MTFPITVSQDAGVFTPRAVCRGCGRPISAMQDWKFAPDGGYLHRACSVAEPRS